MFVRKPLMPARWSYRALFINIDDGRFSNKAIWTAEVQYSEEMIPVMFSFNRSMWWRVDILLRSRIDNSTQRYSCPMPERCEVWKFLSTKLPGQSSTRSESALEGSFTVVMVTGLHESYALIFSEHVGWTLIRMVAYISFTECELVTLENSKERHNFGFWSQYHHA